MLLCYRNEEYVLMSLCIRNGDDSVPSQSRDKTDDRGKEWREDVTSLPVHRGNSSAAARQRNEFLVTTHHSKVKMR